MKERAEGPKSFRSGTNLEGLQQTLALGSEVSLLLGSLAALTFQIRASALEALHLLAQQLLSSSAKAKILPKARAHF